jgi:hypothetical protein
LHFNSKIESDPQMEILNLKHGTQNQWWYKGHGCLTGNRESRLYLSSRTDNATLAI